MLKIKIKINYNYNKLIDVSIDNIKDVPILNKSKK